MSPCYAENRIESTTKYGNIETQNEKTSGKHELFMWVQYSHIKFNLKFRHIKQGLRSLFYNYTYWAEKFYECSNTLYGLEFLDNITEGGMEGGRLFTVTRTY